MISNRSAVITAFAVGLLLSACGEKKQDPTPAPAAPKATTTTVPEATPEPTPSLHPALLEPALANEKAPDTFKTRFKTTKGDFVVQVTRSWAPEGADRFYNLVKIGYYDDVAFFRVIENFMVQFGIHGEPRVNTRWSEARIPDDPVSQSNLRGYVTFATAGPNTRTTQLFINFKDNKGLDGQGFAPFGRVSEGMDVVDKLYAGYGEGAPQGRGPRQDLAQEQGNVYLRESFPKLDYIETAALLE
jgi:peptidyl-prolyl cis-trans isomerase A (cyclophilin A)